MIIDLGTLVDTPVPKVLMPRWPVCACGLPMTLTLDDTGGDESTNRGALSDLVSFLVFGGVL